MQRELIGLATTESLTGVLNRRAFFEKAQELCARAEMGSLASTTLADSFTQCSGYFHSAGMIASH